MNDEVTLNRLSDNQLKFIIKDLNGSIIDPKYKWITIYIKCGDKIFKVINDPSGEETKYCHIENDYLIIDIPSKKLNKGFIEYMIETRNDDINFPDGFKNIFSLNYVKTKIQII